MDTAASEADVHALRPPADVASVEAAVQDAHAGALEPWALLATQWIAGETAGATGERRLMAAVLADAIRLYLKHARSRFAGGRRLFRDTADWFDDRDRSWLFGYRNVCDVLGIDAGRLRDRLRVLAASETPAVIPFDAGRLRIARGRKVRV